MFGVPNDPFLTHQRRPEGISQQRASTTVPLTSDPFLARQETVEGDLRPTSKVPNDPFLSHTQAAERTESRTETRLPQDPFLTGGQPQAPPRGQVPAGDPFLTHTPQPEAGLEQNGSRPAPAPAPVATDPFLAHAAPQQGTSQGLSNLARDPFLVQGQGQPGPDNVNSDPFLTHGSYIGAKSQNSMGDPRLYDQQRFYEALGTGDFDRQPEAGRALIFGPWFIFCLVLVFHLVVWRFSAAATILVTVIIAALCAAMISMWGQGVKGTHVPYGTLGAICLTAVIAGVLVGQLGWNRDWRQFWWMRTGHRLTPTTPATSASARVDAALLDFRSNSTYNAASVDHEKSSGFHDGNMYCVAPILSADVLAPNIAVVNYWAVGINCCTGAGSFTCGDSRDHRGAYAVVMLDRGLPCPGCNHEQFANAITKAEALHGLISANGALYVHWTRDPAQAERATFARAMWFLVIATVVAYVFCFILGGGLWYYGIGKVGGSAFRAVDPFFLSGSLLNLPGYGSAEGRPPLLGSSLSSRFPPSGF